MLCDGGCMSIENLQGVGIGKSHVPYRPEIDGLRTIAVGAVLIFHFDRSLLPGGFIGVDIFFVISGFLISSILLFDISRERFSLGRFYQRRASRILPAALFAILLTTLAASQIYSAQDLASLGASGAAAATSLINFKLLSQHGYFTMSEDAQPLLHYWSLAVEEQFYVVFPVLLMLLMRFTRYPLRIMLGLTGLSFAACVAVTWVDPIVAFYMLPTRAWELLAGACLALHVDKGATLDGAKARWAAGVGVGLIIISVFAIDESARFPGWIAVLPVAGTILLIAPVGTATWPGRLLARPAMVAIGVRSYSLYLWHWPVFSLVDYRFFQSGDIFRGVLKVVITLALSEFSYRFVETPTRKALNAPARRRYVVVGAVASVAAIAIAGLQMRDALYLDISPAAIASGGYIVSGGKGKVLLAGDSEAAMYGVELGRMAHAQRFTLYAVGVPGRNELPGADDTLWPEVSTLLARTKPDVVVLINSWATKLSNPEPLRQALAECLAHARRVVIVLQPPILPEDVSRESIRDGYHLPIMEPPEQTRMRLAANRIIASFRSDRVSIVDVADNFTTENGSVVVVDRAGRMTFKDARHLSDSGTLMARDEISDALSLALGAPKAVRSQTLE